MSNSALLDSYVASMNGRDLDTFADLFAPDARVRDEGHEHRGRAEIKAWIKAAHEKYQPVFAFSEVSETGREIVLTGMVSGTFEGSPLELHHHLVVTDGHIAELWISTER